MDSIQLLQYRNYEDTIFDLGQTTLFIGPNGSGKTNVLEAIRTISVTKSYRVEQDRDAIQWDKNYCRVILIRGEDSFEYVLTYEGQVGKKVIKHNGVVIPLLDIYGLVPTVLFSPESMQLIDGGPGERRRFLDTVLSQVDRKYLESLLVYRKVLRERHFVLLRIQTGLGHQDELGYWDNELVAHGTYLLTVREQFIATLNTLLEKVYPAFLDKNQKQLFKLAYKPQASSQDFAKLIQQQRGIDIKTATTRIGPHRDDIIFLLDDRDVTLFASRGELRRIILALKIAEAEYLRQAKERSPMLLLDDVFSELDELRRSRLHKAIEGYQTVITTTDEQFAKELNLENPVIHHLGAQK